MHQRLDSIQRANLAYIEGMYARYRQDPTSVPEEWALFFAGFDFADARPAAAPAAKDAGQPAGDVFGLVQHFRLLPRARHGAGTRGQKKRPALGWAARILISRCFIPSPCGPLRVRLKE